MLSWIGSALTLLSMYLVGRKLWIGWVVGLIGQGVWLAFAADVGDSGLLFIEVAVAAMAGWNLIKWQRGDQNGKEYVCSEAEAGCGNGCGGCPRAHGAE